MERKRRRRRNGIKWIKVDGVYTSDSQMLVNDETYLIFEKCQVLMTTLIHCKTLKIHTFLVESDYIIIC